MSRFSDKLLDHARHPYNCGSDKDANAIGRADLNGSPPNVEIYLRISNGRVSDASFQAGGCGVTVACCSALTQLLRGQGVKDCLKIKAEQIESALEGIPADKRYCPEVAIAALQNALRFLNENARQADSGKSR